MFYLSSEGDRYYLGRAFNYGDSQYSPAGATAETFAELGFTPVVIQQRPDDAYYIVSGPDATGAYSSTPRDLDQLKAQQDPTVTANCAAATDCNRLAIRIRATPRDLDQVKLGKIQEQLQTAQQLLTATDWLFIRANEMSRGVDVAVPTAVITGRDEVRSVCDTNCDLIVAAEDVPGLESLV